MMHDIKTLTSGGAAYSLEIGYEPAMIKVINKTAFATDGSVNESVWHKGDAAGYSYNRLCDDTGVNSSISTSNGFTVSASSVSGRSKNAISGATQASPGVITCASTADFTSGDRVRIHGVAGMTELNGNDYEIVVIDATTFSLKDLQGDAVDTTNFGAYVASANDYVVNLSDDQGVTGGYKCTLGTDVIGSDGDELVVEILNAKFFEAIGDVG